MKLFYIYCLLLFSFQLFSFEFKYNFNESYRIESTVYQNVLFNKKIELSSIILNKYSVNVIETFNESASLNVSLHVFQESKGLRQGFYTAHTSEKGEIIQYSDGSIDPITNKNFPAVQNIPFFPQRDIKTGESWTAMAIEHFDLKNGFNIDDIITTHFRVFYTYSGNTEIDGREMAIINMSYNIYEKITPYIDWGDFYPMKISGSSKQTLYWDIGKGRPYSVDDKFVLDFYTSTGDQYTFKGNTKSRSWPKNNLDGHGMLKLIKELESNPQTTVSNHEDYLTITFNSLLFDPESSVLKNSVKKYLDNIGSTLKSLGDVNLRILGHTALFGIIDEKYLEALSTGRARSVAEYLLQNGYMDRESIEIKGLGGSIPVDTNNTKEGRSNNRRVEIDILKN